MYLDLLLHTWLLVCLVHVSLCAIPPFPVKKDLQRSVLWRGQFCMARMLRVYAVSQASHALLGRADAWITSVESYGIVLLLLLHTMAASRDHTCIWGLPKGTARAVFSFSLEIFCVLRAKD